MPFASEDVHSAGVARSEASSDAKAVLRFEGLSEKAPIYTVVCQNETEYGFFGFAGRMIVAHFLTYFFIGLLFYVSGLNVLTYYEQHPHQLVNALFRETSSLLVMAGPLFQLLRGLIFALAIYPFRTVFLERKFGWLYLWGIFLALAILAPASAAPGSIEGFVYTNLPISFHLIYLPEIILQTLAFAWLFVVWEKHPVKKLTIPLVVVFFLILLMNGFPVLQYLSGLDPNLP